MTNEEVKKLSNYRGQIEQFGLVLLDEMAAFNCPEWVSIAKEIIRVSQKMTAFINTKIEERLAS